MALRYLHTDPKRYHYRYRARLDGVVYLIEIHATRRDRADASDVRYLLSLSQADGTILARNVKIVLSDHLLRRFKYLIGMPPGRFQVLDSEGLGREPGEGDLGTRVLLAYDEAAA